MRLLGLPQAIARAAAPRLPGNLLRLLAHRLGGATVGPGCRIGPGARIARGASLGAGCRVGRDAALDSDVSLADGCTVGEGARLASLTAGQRTHLETNVLCLGSRRRPITIGRHCYIGAGTLLDHSSEVSLGDFVHVSGPGTALHTHSSVPMALAGCPLEEDRRQYAEIRIGSRCWIGGHVTIYPGCAVGSMCVVLPNSVVTSAVPEGTMVGGAPARRVRTITVQQGQVAFTT